jgi:hypothetical protein
MKLFRSLQICALVGAFVFVTLPNASAIPLDYTVSGFAVPNSPSGSGLIITAATLPATFALDDGEFEAFDFLTITQDISGGASFDDTNVSATVNFSNPAGQAASFNGILSASFPTLTLNPIDPIIALDRTFSVDLIIVQEPPVFGSNLVATVTARVTQLSSGTAPSVPDAGSTAALLGLGLLVLAFAGRRMAIV